MKKIISFLLVCFLVLSCSVPALADVATPSDAVLGSVPEEYLLYPLTPDGDESGIMPFSSIGTVVNTVDLSAVRVLVYYTEILSYDDVTEEIDRNRYANTSVSYNRLKYSLTLPGNCYIYKVDFQFGSAAIPPAGTYNFSMDITSDISHSVNDCRLWTSKLTDNASDTQGNIKLSFSSSSGDVYVPAQPINLTNVDYFVPHILVGSGLHNVGGTVAFRFSPIAADSSAPSTAGTNTTDQDVQNEISSNTSQIANSVSSMSSDLSDAAESLTYISQSQNLIIQGIDNIILHISDQLYAFWDQLYNLIHVPTMAKLNEILQAIKDLDINVNIDLDELKSAISDMKNSIISNQDDNTNKQISNDNQIADDLKNGYDNSGMNSDKEKLDASLNQYEEVEDELLNDAKDNINNFEFENQFTEITGPLSDISYFLGALFSGLGGLSVAMTFSLTLSVALILIGWYRFKGGG